MTGRLARVGELKFLQNFNKNTNMEETIRAI